jgi:cytochrome oxidase assembly protein ShyY1
MSVSARSVALTVLAVIFSALCVVAGLWQGSRTLDIVEAEQAAISAPIPVLEAASVDGFPATSVGRPVTAAGEYADAEQLLVAQRELDGRPGTWVIAPFVIDGVTVAVLRGWVDSPSSPALALPAGPVRLEGALQPFEDSYAEQARRPDGSLVAVSRSEIERAWGGQVVSLILVLRSQDPASVPAPELVPLTVQTADVPFPLQNAAYTLQWFVFAGFVWVMWWLWVIRRDPATTDSLDA